MQHIDQNVSAKATKLFMTASSTCMISDLLQKHCNHIENPISIMTCGGVWFNKKRILKNTLLTKGDTIIVYISDKLNHQYIISKSQIIKETQDWIVAHKPATLSAVPDRSHLYWNMTAGVTHYLQQTNPNYMCQPINRLDWLVEGLMLFSKNKQSEKDLFKLSQQQKITKGYVAIMPAFEGPTFFKASCNISNKGKTYLDPQGKTATTWFIKGSQEYYLAPKYCFYRAILKSGKRHQIRFHSAHFLKPLVGDNMYNSKVKTVHSQIGLIADKLSFTWKEKRYKIHLPINTFSFLK